jgi:hypothetical protein
VLGRSKVFTIAHWTGEPSGSPNVPDARSPMFGQYWFSTRATPTAASFEISATMKPEESFGAPGGNVVYTRTVIPPTVRVKRCSSGVCERSGGLVVVTGSVS